MDSAEVTILIPTYNRATYVVESIESALKQTYQPVSIIVADDASTDNTQAVVAPYVQRGLVRYLRHPRNLGICGNWRQSIAQIDTPYFCILHDDDTFEPSFVESLLRPLEEDQNLAYAFCDHWITDAKGQRLTAETDVQTRSAGREALREGRIESVVNVAVQRQSVPIGATLFRRNVFTPDLVHDEAASVIDFYVLYQCARLGRPIYYVPQRLMNYRVHDNNLSTQRTSGSFSGILFTFAQMIKDPVLTPSERAYFSVRRAGALTTKGNRLLKERRPAEARQCFQESLRIRPSIKSIGGMILSFLGSRA